MQAARLASPDVQARAAAGVIRCAFKLFLVDVGPFGAMAGLSARTTVEGQAIFEEFKGALTEQYVCEQLVAGCGLKPFYWAGERSSAEVDFVVQREETIYGMEVKAAENLRSKSLRSFHTRYRRPDAFGSAFLAAGRRTGWSMLPCMPFRTKRSGKIPRPYSLNNRQL